MPKQNTFNKSRENNKKLLTQNQDWTSATNNDLFFKYKTVESGNDYNVGNENTHFLMMKQN